MRDHLVSVIVPTCNRSEILSETIKSILSQTYPNFELIVVDDGSTDDTKNIVSGFNDSRIEYVYIRNWGGPARPRNIGIKKAKGNYIAFCDDDDIWHPEKLFYQIKKFENSECVLCYTDFDYITNNGKRLNKKSKLKKYYKNLTFNKFMLSGGIICSSSVMIKCDVIETIGLFDEDPRLISAEDYHYWARILNKHKPCFVDKTLVSYRIDSTDSIRTPYKYNWFKNEMYLLNSINSTVKVNKIIYVIKLMKLFLIKMA